MRNGIITREQLVYMDRVMKYMGTDDPLYVRRTDEEIVVVTGVAFCPDRFQMILRYDLGSWDPLTECVSVNAWFVEDQGLGEVNVLKRWTLAWMAGIVEDQDLVDLLFRSLVDSFSFLCPAWCAAS